MYQFIDPTKSSSFQLGSKKFSTSLEDIATGELYTFFIKEDFPRHMEFLHAVYAKKDPRYIYDTFIDPNAQKAIYIRGAVGEDILNTLLTPEEQRQAFEAGKKRNLEDEELAGFWEDIEFQPTKQSFDEALTDAVMAAKVDLGLRHHKDFFSSASFKDFCWSVIGTPSQTAKRLGVKNAKGQELLGDLSIAVAVRNKALIAEIGAKFIDHQGTDLTLKDIVKALDGGIKLKERETATDWRAQAWANGSFELAVRQMLTARSSKDKKAEVFNFGTALKIVTESIDPTVSKREVLEEIMARSREIMAKAKDPASATPEDQTGSEKQADDPWKLSAGVVNKIDWKKFAEIYDIDLEDETDLKDIAMRIVKKGEDAALNSSKSLLAKRGKTKKKRGFTFKNPKHFAAAVTDVLRRKTGGQKLTKALKPSMMADSDTTDA